MCSVAQSRPTLRDPVDCSLPDSSVCPCDLPGKNTGVGCHFLLHGIFPTQRLSPNQPVCQLLCAGLADLMGGVTSDFIGFSNGSSCEEFTCHCRRCKRCRFDPWVGKIPWRRKWQPTPVFLPGESQGQRSLVGYSPWGRTESDMTEHQAHQRYSIPSGCVSYWHNSQ